MVEQGFMFKNSDFVAWAFSCYTINTLVCYISWLRWAEKHWTDRKRSGRGRRQKNPDDIIWGSQDKENKKNGEKWSSKSSCVEASYTSGLCRYRAHVFSLGLSMSVSWVFVTCNWRCLNLYKYILHSTALVSSRRNCFISGVSDTWATSHLWLLNH